MTCMKPRPQEDRTYPVRPASAIALMTIDYQPTEFSKPSAQPEEVQLTCSRPPWARQ